MNIEADGDSWHSIPKRIAKDNLRDNDLQTIGWRLLRFNTQQIREQMAEYCLPIIEENVTKLGGPSEAHLNP